MNEQPPLQIPPPWWKFGYVWLVISGPAAVALAAVVTVWLALAYPETLVADDYYRRGIEINPDYVLDSHWNENEAYSGMLQLLTLPEPPTALYCCNYNMAVGALRRIKEQGLRVPDDISLISFDDVPLFRLHESGITAIAQPVAKIAETISSILTTRLSDRTGAHAPHTITLDCDIILRGSTRRLLTPEKIARRPNR